MEVTAGRIKTFHSLLADDVSDVTGSDVNVKPEQGVRADWENLYVGKRPLRFMMTERSSHIVSGEGYPVLPLSDHEETRLWLGWLEEWLPLGGGEFGLFGLGWRLFWGRAFGTKTKLIRAEWDHADNRGKNSCQPHWHAGLGAKREVESHELIRTPNLEELPAKESDERHFLFMVDFADMHLGMAGWPESGEDDYPVGWQRVPNDIACLKNWACATLKHIVGEVNRIKHESL